MTVTSGADPDQLDVLARELTGSASRLRSVGAGLRARVHDSPWGGRDADALRADWDARHAPAIESAAQQLDAASHMIVRNAADQRLASAAPGGTIAGLAGAVGGLTGIGVGAGGDVPVVDASPASFALASLALPLPPDATLPAPPVGGDALFRHLTGHDPVTEQDRRLAATLAAAPAPGAAPGEPPANITAVRITPVPGGGQVYGDAFISGSQVVGPNPLDPNLGDSRGFDPAAGPDRSRVSFVVDYDSGLVVVRQNPSHALSGDVAVGTPLVGVEQDAAGRVRLRTEAVDGLAPAAIGDLGWAVRSDLVVDPHGAPDGGAAVNGTVSQFPSWEIYHSTGDGPPSPVFTRVQNDGDSPLGPALNLPLDSVPAGAHPEALDQWRTSYHGDQVAQATAEDQVRSLDPYAAPEASADPFYDYPLPPAPDVVPDPGPTTRVDPPSQIPPAAPPGRVAEPPPAPR